MTVWYRYKEVDGFDKNEVIFAKEYSVDRFDYWLITKPKELKGFEKFATLARKIAERDNIVNVAAIFARMLEIVDNELKDKEKPKKNLKAKK